MINNIIRNISSIGLIFIIFNTSYADNLEFNQGDIKKFDDTNLCTNCDLSNAMLTGNHSKANLNSTNLSNAYGSAINLSQSVLINTNFSNSSFTYANFSQADFSKAALYQADFSWANLYKAKITAEQIAELKSVCNATLPDGSKGLCK